MSIQKLYNISVLDTNLKKILSCPICKSSLAFNKNEILCKYRHRFPMRDGIPDFLDIHKLEDKKSHSRWNELYDFDTSGKSKRKLYAKYKTLGKRQFEVIQQIIHSRKGKLLEIGCGISMTSSIARKLGWQTYGIDYSLRNLQGAKEYWEYLGLRGNFVSGDILHMPFSDESFDVIYGGGVLEHVLETQKCVKGLYRITKKGGTVVNTVPAFSLSSITYRQLSGTIPEVPVLKQIFEFIHIKVLKRKLMHTGYEKCFTKDYLEKIHKKAGFRNVVVKHQESFVPVLTGFPPILKKIVIKLEKQRPFWAWWVITAEK